MRNLLDRRRTSNFDMDGWCTLGLSGALQVTPTVIRVIVRQSSKRKERGGEREGARHLRIERRRKIEEWVEGTQHAFRHRHT